MAEWSMTGSCFKSCNCDPGFFDLPECAVLIPAVAGVALVETSARKDPILWSCMRHALLP